MAEDLSRERVVSWWARVGLQDYFIGFILEESFPWNVLFFYQQGLEKVCKAYMLGNRASEYEELSTEEDILQKIDEIAKSMRHELPKIISGLSALGVLEAEVQNKEYVVYGERKITGRGLLEILDSAYIECRYPVPDPIYRKYPLGNGYWYPAGSSEPKDFAMELGRLIIQRIENDFKLTIDKENPSWRNHEDWERFCRIFFQK